MPLPDKYVVVKKVDFDAWRETHDATGTPVVRSLESKMLNDAVVIRLQDVFSRPAFDAYAASILVALELTKPTPENKETREHLQALADYFHTMAERAAHTRHKIPD